MHLSSKDSIQVDTGLHNMHTGLKVQMNLCLKYSMQVKTALSV
jgi:hypothetical protein